jgi:hypothetical protein
MDPKYNQYNRRPLVTMSRLAVTKKRRRLFRQLAIIRNLWRNGNVIDGKKNREKK